MSLGCLRRSLAVRIELPLARLVALVAVALLGGCVAAPTLLPTPVSGQGFALEGRISVNYGTQNVSGRLQWTHELARDEIALASPLGTQVARLVRDATGVTLTDSEQATHRAADAETLTQQRLGWRLPLDGLADWVRGRASPGTPGTLSDSRLDSHGRLASLAQSDWRIEYGYDDAAAVARLPRRLFMRYLQSAEPLEIRLVIDQWTTP